MKAVTRFLFGAAGLAGATALCVFLGAASAADTLKADTNLSTKEVGSKENVVSDFIADAIRAASKSDASFLPASAFNDSFSHSKGPLNTADIVNALAYRGENILVVKLTGEQIMRALEQGLLLYPKPNSAFLQVSGLTVVFNPTAEAGKRVVSVKIDGQPLDTAKSYKVAMPAPLANGGLAFFKIWKKSSILKDTEQTVDDAAVAYSNDTKTLPDGNDRLLLKK